MPRFAAEIGFIHETAKQGDKESKSQIQLKQGDKESKSQIQLSQRRGVLNIYG